MVYWLPGSPSHQLLDLHPVPVQSCPSWEVNSPFPLSQPMADGQPSRNCNFHTWIWGGLETHIYLVAWWTHHGVASPRWGRLLPCPTWDSIWGKCPTPTHPNIPGTSLPTPPHLTHFTPPHPPNATSTAQVEGSSGHRAEERPGRAGNPVGRGEAVVKNPSREVGRWQEVDLKWAWLQTPNPHIFYCLIGLNLQNTNSKIKLLNMTTIER